MIRNKIIFLIVFLSSILLGVGDLLIHQAVTASMTQEKVVNFIGYLVNHALIFDIGIWLMFASSFVLSAALIFWFIIDNL